MSDYYYAGDNAATQTLIVRADEVDSYQSLEDFGGMLRGRSDSFPADGSL